MSLGVRVCYGDQRSDGCESCNAYGMPIIGISGHLLPGPQDEKDVRPDQEGEDPGRSSPWNACHAFFAVLFVVFRVVVRDVVFFAGALARRSASSSAARSGVSDSTSSPLRKEALLSPSVT